jgi:hypothetical protein
VRTVKSKRNIFLGGFTQSRASLVSNFDSPDTADAYGGAGSSDGASDQDPRTAAGTYRSHIAALEERVRELQEIKDELAPRAARHVALRGKLEALYDILFDDPSDVAEEMGARREVIGSQAVYDKVSTSRSEPGGRR